MFKLLLIKSALVWPSAALLLLLLLSVSLSLSPAGAHPMDGAKQTLFLATSDGRAMECTCLCETSDWGSLATCVRTPPPSESWALSSHSNHSLATVTTTTTTTAVVESVDPCQCYHETCFCKPVSTVHLQRRACSPRPKEKEPSSASPKSSPKAQTKTEKLPQQRDVTLDLATLEGSPVIKSFDETFSPLLADLNANGGCISPTKCVIPDKKVEITLDPLRSNPDDWKPLGVAERGTMQKFKMDTLLDHLQSHPDLKVDKDNLLGEGSFGVVYEAKDAQGRSYAVKFPKMDKNFNEIMDEAKKLLQLRDMFPNPEEADFFLLPSRVFWIKVDGKRAQLGIVMERMEMDLQQYVEKGGENFMYMVKMVSDQLFHGLALLHSKNFLHNDIKPENVMLNLPGTDQHALVRLGDFGLSKSVDKFKKIGGTVSYMGPEELFLHGSSPSADVWAAGLTVFELATRKILYSEFYPALAHRLRRRGYDVQSDPNNVWFYRARILAMFGKEKLPPKHFAMIPEPVVKAVEELKLPLIQDYLKAHSSSKSSKIRPLETASQEQADKDQANLMKMIGEILRLNPNDRISAAALHEHPFFEGMESA